MTVLESLSLKDFRNYTTLAIDGLGPLTILVGPNGAGKTNLIEAIQMVCAGAPFRHGTLDQMISVTRKNQERLPGAEPIAVVNTRLLDGERTLDIAVRLKDHGRTYLVNGNARKPSTVRDLISTVTFTPDDLTLVKGSMSGRRTALDSLGRRLSTNYSKVISDYSRVLRHKNRLLREEAALELIDAIDELVITCGAQLTCLRLALLEHFVGPFVQRFDAITKGREQLTVCYHASWEGEAAASARFCSEGEAFRFTLGRDEAREALKDAIAGRRGDEQRRGHALVGPHADAIELLLDGQPAESFASQGQQRTLVLAYKLGEALTIEAMKGSKPVLLLDDVMSELDEQRRSALVAYLSSGAQTFITTTNLAYFDEALVDDAQVFFVEGGALCER